MEKEIFVEEESVQLTKDDLLRLGQYTWVMSGYIPAVGFQCNSTGITRREAERIFQLDPPPPVEDENTLIRSAIEQQDLRYIGFFLHHYERKLNGRIYRFLARDGSDRYDPERFLDLKLSCLEVILKKFPDFAPEKNAKFTTYLYDFLEDAMLSFRMREETWTIPSLAIYKNTRLMASLYRRLRENPEKAITAFCKQTGCTEVTAARYLETACGIRAKQSYFVSHQDEDSEETGEEAGRDDSWNYSAILWNGMQASAIQKAFWKLRPKDQALLEKRNAICMACGRVGSWLERYSYEQLSAIFQASTDKGAERAYNKAVEKLTELLVADGVLHAVRLKRTEQKKSKKKRSKG